MTHLFKRYGIEDQPKRLQFELLIREAKTNGRKDEAALLRDATHIIEAAKMLLAVKPFPRRERAEALRRQLQEWIGGPITTDNGGIEPLRKPTHSTKANWFGRQKEPEVAVGNWGEIPEDLEWEQ